MDIVIIKKTKITNVILVFLMVFKILHKVYVYYIVAIDEYSANSPNNMSITPESLFIQTILSGVILDLKKLTRELNMSHQSVEPIQIPSTRVIDDAVLVCTVPRPSPANTAKNDNMVVGLVRVKKNVEIKLLTSPLPPACAAADVGLVIHDFIPRNIKNIPPINCIQNSCAKRNEEITVNPNPAIMPYTVSAIAAPIPVTNPEIRPSVNVRFMVSTPIGPTGAAIESPMMIPLSR